MVAQATQLPRDPVILRYITPWEMQCMFTKTSTQKFTAASSVLVHHTMDCHSAVKRHEAVTTCHNTESGNVTLTERSQTQNTDVS